MIVLTGASGFIGSNILYSLNKLGIEELILCDIKTKNNRINNLKDKKFIKIIEPEELTRFLDKNNNVEVIVHMGANSSTTEKNFNKIYKQNTRFTKNLWNWARDNNVRFIYASSAAIYGDGSKGFNETTSLENYKPLNLYGWTKYFFDRYALEQDKIGKKPPQWVGLRFFNVYGPNEYHKEKMQSVIINSFMQCKNEGIVKLFKSYKKNIEHGHQKRDFIYVKDCVSVILWILDNSSISGIFNCGTGQARSFKDLAMAMYSSINKQPSIKYIEMPKNLKEQYQYFTEAKMDKIIEAGYHKKFIKLEDGIEDYVQNYLSNKRTYR